jgi:glycine/D-amino acid oxidase-like deaminating enzyme
LLQAFVVVVGAGGVGSAAAHVLLRTGVGKLRIIDPGAFPSVVLPHPPPEAATYLHEQQQRSTIDQTSSR